MLDVERDFAAFTAAAVSHRAPLIRRFQYLYSDTGLQRYLADCFGATTLADAKLQTGMLLLATRLETSEPFTFTNHPAWDGLAVWSGVPLADLVLACSVLPWSFPAKRLAGNGEQGVFADAGISVGNNPSLYSLLSATSSRYPFDWRFGRNWLALTAVGVKETAVRKPLEDVEQPNLLELLPGIVNGLIAGAAAQSKAMLETFGLEDDAQLTYCRYEIGNEVEPAKDMGELPSKLPEQIAAARPAAARLIRMGDFRKSFDVRRPA
jgi:hypothetical protein